MIERKSISIRLYPSAEQETLFRKTGGCVRLVKNLALEQRSVFGRSGRLIGYFSQRAELAALKDEAPFLREVPHHCLQEALIDLDRAFKNFFAGRAGYPKFQSKHNSVSFRFPDPKQFRIEGDTATPDKQRNKPVREITLRLPKAGAVRGVMHRALPHGAVIKKLTVSSDGDWWVASLQYEREVDLPDDRSCEELVGIDLNVAQPVVSSTGETLHLPRVNRRRQERECRLGRSIARKKKGSSNRRKAVRAMARFKAGQARRRKDAREKLTTQIAKNHGVIAAEGLNIRAMTASARGTIDKPGKNVAQKAGLNRSVLDLGLGMIRLRLGQKLAACGGMLLFVPAPYTSQRCNSCGHIEASNRPERDTFRCLACNHIADPDFNASCNIRDYALGLWGDPSNVKIAWSLPLLLQQQGNVQRMFGKKTRDKAGGSSAAACGDLGVSWSAKQEMTSGDAGKKAARAAGSLALQGGEEVTSTARPATSRWRSC